MNTDGAMYKWRIQRGSSGGSRPSLVQNFFLNKPSFPVKKAYSSLCEFAINDDEADTSSSVPPLFQNFWIRHCYVQMQNRRQCTKTRAKLCQPGYRICDFFDAKV